MTMATWACSKEINNGIKRLSLDLVPPDSALSRRYGISFGPTSLLSKGRPRIGRRSAVSLNNQDRDAVYIRQLGDVCLKSQSALLYKHMLNSLPLSEKRALQRLASPGYRTRCGHKFSTISGMRRHRKSLSSLTAHSQSLVDDYYLSSTKCLLEKASDWTFDVFSLDQLSNGRPLFHIIFKLFHEHNLIEHFNLDVIKLMKFASLIEEGYHQNPYHNAIHAADVTQAMHCYIMQEKIYRHLNLLEIMIALLSAITHDLDHPGVNQAFLIATSNHLASLYKNNSVLENHHWRTAVGMLHESGLFDHLSLAVRKTIYRQMKSLILATDMTRQQEFYSKLKAHISGDDLDMSRPDDRHFILQIALKCADISNPCRSWSTCKSWSKRVCDEFFQQGDYERKLTLPITNLCDRYKFKVSKIQTGFIDFVVEPLFTEFEKFLPCDMLTEQLENVRANRLNWEMISKEESSLITMDTDINSNRVGPADGGSSADSGTESDAPCSPVSTEPSSSHSDLDELPYDIDDIHSDIALVAGRMDRSEGAEFPRRGSLPTSDLPKQTRDSSSRRESFPRIDDNRRTCLPHTTVYQAVSFDRLVEKLTNLEHDLYHRNSGTLTDLASMNLDNLLCEPRLSTLSPSLETSKITHYLTAADRVSLK